KLLPLWLKKKIAYVTIFALVSQPLIVGAEAVADSQAAEQNRPKVETTQNGTPIVQITAPSAAGVSRNIYSQFNVDPQGLILNNSQTLTQTQLAGYITGNPNLANGTAKIILNEVSGHDPSTLRGYTEVAGSRAEVVIANPNGITGNGFGFINASRAVLTTGTPVFGGNDSLEAFRVNQGQITVEGNGMDAQQTDRADLISRAVQINAGIWGKEVNVVAGANQVEHDSLQATVLPADNNRPQVAIDVSALGGMYANKIRLVGTEEGLGVNSQGTLSSLNGNMELTNDGKVALAGSIHAAKSITIHASQDITNQGTIYAKDDIHVNSASGTLVNTGMIAAAQNTDISAQLISSSGIVGSGINTDGSIGNSGNLSINTTNGIVAQGKNLAGGNLALTGKSIELSGAATYAGGNASITATNGDVNNTGGMIQINHALTIQSNGSVQNDKGVNGQAGQIIADKLTIETGQLLNQSGIIQQTGIDNTNVIVTSNIDNSDGTIITNGYNLSLQAGVITNNQGQIQHAGNGTLLIQNTGELKNINGNIASNGQITSQTQNVVNTQGTIEAKRQISVSASSLTNNQGTITSENAVCITTPGTINNQQGSILSNKDLKITAQSLSNLGGNIINHDTSDMNITVSQDIQNQSGIIGGNGNIGISYQNLINRGGKVQAQDNLNISSAETTDNTNGSISAEKDVIFRQNSANLTNANGNINAGGNLDVQATIVDNLNGSIAANKDLTLQAQSLNGNGLAIAGQDLAITLNGNFTNSSVGQLRANRNLKLLTSGTVLNQGIMTAVGNTTIDGNKVTNDNAATMAAGEDFNLIASEDVNNNGQLDGNLVTIRGQNVSNTGSMTANNLTITSNNLTNTGASAVIASTTDINLNIENSLINKDAATIYSMGNTTVAGSAGRDETEKPIDRAVSVLNQSAIIQADKDMQIYANEITNKKREFVTGQTVVSQASNGNPGQLINTSYVNKSFFPWELSGMVPFDAIIVPVTVPVGTYLKGQVIRETSILKDSPEGKILAGRNMTLDAGNINNNLSWILAAGALNASVDASINNVTIGRTRDITKLYHEYTDYWAGVEYYYWTTEKVYAGIDPTNYEPIYDERRVFNSGHAMGHVYNDRDLPSSTTTEALSDQYTSLYGGGQSLNLQAHAINNIVNSPVGVPGSDNATLPASQSPNLAGAHANHISITLPTNGLYTIHPEPESHYLIETNPRFANFSNFISSDYMLKQLHIDFDKSLKQIGDGFYEQQLIRDRLVQLTGRQVINGYSSSQEQYKALLDNGVTYAKQFNLQVGVTLTAAQMAQLTSDMVWLVEQEVQGQKVLVPIVYLAQTRVGDLKASGALMSADEVVLKSNGDLTNIGIIKANDQIDVSASNIINHGGSFEGKQITLQADKNIAISGGQVSATGDIIVNAGQNLKFDSLQTSQRIAIPFSVMETTTNLTSSIKAGGDINLVAGQDANLAGAQVGAGQDLTLTSIAGNINISAVKDEKMIDTKTGTSRNWKRTRTDDETIVGSTLQAGGNINIVAVNPESTKTNGGSITIAGSNVYSDSGKISINADKDVTVQEATEKHESLVEKHQVKSGFLSKKTTDTRDYSLINQAVGSTISGDTVDIHANNDITVQGSNVVGSNAVDLIAENDINLTSAAETGASEHYKVTKKSGLFSGGGLGVTIGKQSEKLDVNEKTLDQVGSTIGSVNESVSINAGKQVTSDGTTLVAQKDITITGNNVSINNSVDTYDSQTQYEFKQSGISVSLGGGVVNTLTDTASHVERSSQVSDDRLKALYDYKAAKD
ncbi:two-partner secretion domain-containing protein, partial [Propionispora vibrioides]